MITLAGVAFGAVGTTGQRCTTTRRLFLHEDIAEDFIRRLVAAYESMTIGNPLEDGVLVGPLIDEDAICVGSIADEKNDKLYWFVLNNDSQELVSNGSFDNDTWDWQGETGVNTGPYNLPLWTASQAATAGGIATPTQFSWYYDDVNKRVRASGVEYKGKLFQYNVGFDHGRTYIIKADIGDFISLGDSSISPVIVDSNYNWTTVPSNKSPYVANSTNTPAAGSTEFTWTFTAGLKNIEGHTGFITSIIFSNDGNTIVSGSADTTIKLWNTISGK